MKTKLLYCFTFLVISNSCSKGEYVDQNKSSFYYYSDDKSKVLYNTNSGITSLLGFHEFEEVTSDVDNFVVLSSSIGKDSKHGYYKYKATKEIDTKTIYIDSLCYNNTLCEKILKNKDFVFVIDEDADLFVEIEGADPSTYGAVMESSSCFRWTRDKNHYYYRNKRTEADRETMSFLLPLLPYDKKYIFNMHSDGSYKLIPYRGQITVVNEYMLHDNDSVYYIKDCGSYLRTIKLDNPKSIRFIDKVKHIFKVNNDIFVQGIKILANIIDGETFEIIDDRYSRDKNHVYSNFNLLEHADPATFKILNDSYVKDHKFVFYDDTLIENANPETFEILESGYSRDDKSVYYKIQKLDGINPTSFEIINTLYTKDDKHVYYNHILIEDADPHTFSILPKQDVSAPSYTRDRNHIFFNGKILSGADIETFIVLSRLYCKDKNRVYEGGGVLENYKPEEFIEDKWGRFPTEFGYGKAPKQKKADDDDDDDD